jgi:catechol 2,3-dioxygenase-like lactoylglutathione lyase family enzyme
MFSPEAERVRAFFDQVLGFPSVDAGHGWLIFALPPAELAVHPSERPVGPTVGTVESSDRAGGPLELYLMCDDLQETLQDLADKGVEPSRPVREERWGVVTAIRLPDGGEIGLYEPRHPVPPH